MAKIRVVSTKWRIYLKEKQRLATVGEELTLITLTQRALNSVVTENGDPIYKFFAAFEECCEECRNGYAHHSWLLTSIDQLFTATVKQQEGQLELDMGKKERQALTATEINRMMAEILAVWRPAAKVLHIANVKYQTMGSLLRIERIMRGGVEVVTYNANETVARQYAEPMFKYYKEVESLLKIFQESSKITLESIHLIMESLRGYGAMFDFNRGQLPA